MVSKSFRCRYNAYMKARKRAEVVAKIVSIFILAMCFCPVAWHFLSRESGSVLHFLWEFVKLIILTVISLRVTGFLHLLIERCLLYRFYAKEITKV